MLTLAFLTTKPRGAGWAADEHEVARWQIYHRREHCQACAWAVPPQDTGQYI